MGTWDTGCGTWLWTTAALQLNSSTPNGSYGIGEPILISLTFSKEVLVEGSPLLSMNTGSFATFIGGSGTDTLVFQYTVQEEDNVESLEVHSPQALSPEGGTLVDHVGNPAILTLPQPGAQGSLSQNRTITLDTRAPKINALGTSTSSGHYKAGKNMNLELRLDEAVFVTGTPRIALNSGGEGIFSTGSGSSTLIFLYSVSPGENAALLDIQGPQALILEEGTSILDLAGNSVETAIPAQQSTGSLPSQRTISIDTLNPEELLAEELLAPARPSPSQESLRLSSSTLWMEGPHGRITSVP